MLALPVSLLLFPAPSQAADFGPALTVNTSFEADIPVHQRRQLRDLLHTALQFVQMFPPQGYDNNLFQWSADRQVLNGKTLSMVFTTSQNQTISPIIGRSDPGMDGFTMVPMNQIEGTTKIMVILLADRLFYDFFGRERPNGFSRLILALAHEIYGNVQHFLEFDVSTAEPQTLKDRFLQERKAFTASLMFLGGLKDHERFATLPEKIREDLMNLLPSEIRAFRSWQTTHPSLAPDPACEAMLASITKDM